MSKRSTVALVVVVVAAFTIAVVVALRVIGHNREALVQRFTSEWLHQVERAAIELENDFEAIGDDLRLAAQLASTADSAADRERELLAIVTVGRIYRLIQVRDADTASLVSVSAPGAAELERERAIHTATDAAAAGAVASPGRVIVSRPIGLDEWLRAFALAPPEMGHESVVIAVADTRGLFGKLDILGADASASVLVLGAHGQPVPVSDETLRAALLRESERGSSEYASLVARMRRAEHGTVRIPAAEAARLGLDGAEHVAVFAPIRVPSGEPWSIALLASTASLREHERSIAARMTLVVGAVAAFFIGIAGAVVAVSRREVALRERLRHADQLARSEKLATVGVLAAGIAHEIGTPLGVVRGRAEYLAGKLGTAHPHAGGLQVIVDQIDRVTRTIRQLLDFSRQRPADARLTELGPVVDNVVELLRIEAERRGVTTEVALAAELPPLAADPDQLQQVLVNLVMNAYDACERGGQVAVTGARVGTRVRIEVRDDGRGIPEAEHNRVFDPFYTTKKRGQGTGLGLTIVSQIVRNHGGSIELASRPGDGTTVTVMWPVSTGAPDAA